MTRDVEGAKRFYQSTIGWSFDAMPMADGGTYWLAISGGKPVAGIFSLTSPVYDGVPESWMSYLAVESRLDKGLPHHIGPRSVRPAFSHQEEPPFEGADRLRWAGRMRSQLCFAIQSAWTIVDYWHYASGGRRPEGSVRRSGGDRDVDSTRADRERSERG